MSKTRILGVHGVGNLQPGLDPAAAGELIAGWWQGALGSLPSGKIDTRVYYYAHHLVGLSAQGDGDLSHLDEGTEADIVAWASQLGARQEIPQGRLTQPVRAGVEWVASRFGLDHALAVRFVATFFPEVTRYFTIDDARRQSVAGLSAELREWQPRILVAHSLGSVVAYEALWTHPLPEVDLFLTLGSPLAMPDVVFPRLARHPGPRRRPPGVRRWINIADRGDIVAIPAGGIGRSFEDLSTDVSDSIHAFDFHRATNYLACPAATTALAAVV